MAISVADNFSYQGGKPLDARMKFDTVALMVATPAASLYDGCFAYVKATKKYYSYDSANEADPTLGKWVEYSSGDAPEYDDFTGATSEAAGAHGLVPAPAIADREKFLKGDGTWVDVPLPSFDYSNTSPEAMNFSTDEKVIGTWTDGKPLYQKTVNLSIPSDYIAETTISLASGISNLAYGMIVNGRIKIGDNGNNLPLNYNANDAYAYCSITGDGTIIRYKSSFAGSNISLILTIQYTKTTDTAVASGEKIIGQWIDGKPLYQKSYVFSKSQVSSGEFSVSHDIDNVDKIWFDVSSTFLTSGTGSVTWAMSAWNTSTPILYCFFGVWCKNTKTNGIDMYLGSELYNAMTNSDSVYVTVQYTKTTV